MKLPICIHCLHLSKAFWRLTSDFRKKLESKKKIDFSVRMKYIYALHWTKFALANSNGNFGNNILIGIFLAETKPVFQKEPIIVQLQHSIKWCSWSLTVIRPSSHVLAFDRNAAGNSWRNTIQHSWALISKFNLVMQTYFIVYRQL